MLLFQKARQAIGYLVAELTERGAPQAHRLQRRLAAWPREGKAAWNEALQLAGPEAAKVLRSKLRLNDVDDSI